ncbi:glycosyltransferase [Ruegeria sp. Alg231-54]|uniref:glycosyltransferase n=1 Tax=Ruegeria sp. Alg231-54 TaxID=1922221 RepID=UPI00131ED7C6|nr:glycosyltransferase [Ruegeria sp. Alg231-54]
MIFLTVGTHEPFDRLVRCVDDWCGARGVGTRVFGQITKNAQYSPRNFETVSTLEPDDYSERFRTAEFVISHAGMGTIIMAQSMKKPIVLLPRRGHLRETRNDHQFATIKRFGNRDGVFAAQEETELTELLDRVSKGNVLAGGEVPAFADAQLIDVVKDFIHAGSGRSQGD